MRTTEELINNAKELKTLMVLQLGQMANRNNGIDYFDFQKYLSRPETNELFTKIRQVKAELRARGVVVPEEFPE